MYITKIHLINVGIFSNEEQEAGKINVIEGRIGSGKTTFENAIVNALSGGNDKSLIKHGEDQAEIHVWFDDGVHLFKTLGQEGFDWKIFGADGNEITKKVASYIDQLRKLDSVNASNFIDGDDKERLKILLEAWDVKLDNAKLATLDDGITYKKATNPLDTLSNLDKSIYDKRTGINTLADDNEAAANKILETLPPVSEISHTEQLADLRRLKANAEKEKDSERTEAISIRDEQIRVLNDLNEKVISKFNSDHDTEVKRLNAEHDALIRRLNQEHEAKIQGLNAEHDKTITGIKSKHDPEVANVRAECDTTLADITKRYDEKVTPLISEIASLEQQSVNAAVIEKQRQIANDYKSAAAGYKAQSDELTARRATIHEWKQDLVKGFPIEGFDIIDGVIHIDEIPWKRVNDGKKIQIALLVAQRLSGEIKVICMNGMEAIDPENFEIMKEELRRSDKQYFFTRVESIDLKFTAISESKITAPIIEEELVTA